MSNKRKTYDKDKIKELTNRYGFTERTARRWLGRGLVNDYLDVVDREEKIRLDPNDIIKDCLALLDEVEDYTLEGSILPKIESLRTHSYITKEKYNYIVSKLKENVKSSKKNKVSLI